MTVSITFFQMDILYFALQISLKIILKGQNDNKSALVQVMA